MALSKPHATPENRRIQPASSGQVMISTKTRANVLAVFTKLRDIVGRVEQMRLGSLCAVALVVADWSCASMATPGDAEVTSECNGELHRMTVEALADNQHDHC